MPTPRADSYSIASGAALHAGRQPPPHASVLDLIAAAPAESWVRLNAGKNTFASVEPHIDLRAWYGGVPADSEMVQGAWPSFGWDSTEHQIVLFGGGHANTSANEVYVWRCEDQQWALAFHASEMVYTGVASTYRSIDDVTPVSSHTYGNNNFLPILNRFWTFGGAAYNTGGSLRMWSGDTNLRAVGGYTLDLSQARQGKVAGATGSNNKRGAYAGVNLDGANAWTRHDWFSKPNTQHPYAGGITFNQHIDAGTAYLTRNGHDALIYTAQNKYLWQVEFVDGDWNNDVHTYLAAQGSTAGQGQGQLAYDPVSQTVLQTRGGPQASMFEFVDLKRTWGASNGWRVATMAAGAAATELQALNLGKCGLIYNPIKGCFTIWDMGRQVWEVYPPAGNPTPDGGWVVVKPTMDAGTAPRDTYASSGQLTETGIIGKFRWASDLNAAITTFGNQAGEVWAYKPAGWTDPRT